MIKFIFEGIDFPSLNVALDLAKRAKRSRGRYKKKYTGSLYDVEKSKLNTLIGTIARQQHIRDCLQVNIQSALCGT